MSRAHLRNRRPSQSFEIEHFDPLAGPVGTSGAMVKLHIGIGEFEDGACGEVFVSVLGKTGKGSMLEALGRDIAILISLATQYGAPIGVMRRAMTRDEKDRPATMAGAVLDAMEG